MKTVIRLLLLLILLCVGGVALIKILYDVSWEEALDIAIQFAEDLLS